MTTITPEQKIALAEAGDLPIELDDPQTGDAFILVRAEVYRRLLEEKENSLLTEVQLLEVERRLTAYESSPESAITWEQVLADVDTRLKP